jgi:3-phytase
VPGDSDDPAIWFHPTDPAQSLILGTDKGGGLYTFDLSGKMLAERTVTGLSRPNNVDVEQGVILDGKSVDLAVVTERDGGRVRVFSLPEVKAIDGGGIDVFAGETADRKAPMGVGLYKRPADGALFAIVSRKTGPADGYLWQYRIEGDGASAVRFTKVREFGAFSGSGEIEAIYVDDALGWVYYSDEWKGIRKYAADPDSPEGNRELALFGVGKSFREDREGLSVYALDDRTGYLIASDQQANRFRVYPREGTAKGPHDHPELASIPVSTVESDGSETTSRAMGPDFPHGLFIAMSEDKTFQLYRWEDLAGDVLRNR